MPTDPTTAAEVAADLIRRIRAGEYPPGAKLPVESALRAQYDVSKVTAHRAIKDLQRDGWVWSAPGKGTFVRDRRELVRRAAGRYRRGHHPVRDEADANGITVTLDGDPHILRNAPASADVAERLNIEPGDPVTQVTYRWRAGGELYQISTQWEPLHITGGTTAEHPSVTIDDPDVIARMDAIGWAVTHVQESIRARPAAAGNPLGVPAGLPLFHITRTHWAGETPVETADIVIRADRIVIENRNDVPPEEPPMPDLPPESPQDVR